MFSGLVRQMWLRLNLQTKKRDKVNVSLFMVNSSFWVFHPKLNALHSVGHLRLICKSWCSDPGKALTLWLRWTERVWTLCLFPEVKSLVWMLNYDEERQLRAAPASGAFNQIKLQISVTHTSPSGFTDRRSWISCFLCHSLCLCSCRTLTAKRSERSVWRCRNRPHDHGLRGRLIMWHH